MKRNGGVTVLPGVVAVLLLAIALVVPAAAQTSAAPGGKDARSQTGQTKGDGLASSEDKEFLKEAAIGGLMEVQLGQAAEEKARSQDVKNFGKRMVTDHGRANDGLKALAQRKNETVPSQLDPKHQAMVDKLSKLSGAEFDTEYMRAMVKDHTRDVADFRKATRDVKDSDLSAWANKTLPVLEQHLQQAKDVAQKLGIDVSQVEKEGQTKAETKEKTEKPGEKQEK